MLSFKDWINYRWYVLTLFRRGGPDLVDSSRRGFRFPSRASGPCSILSFQSSASPLWSDIEFRGNPSIDIQIAQLAILLSIKLYSFLSCLQFHSVAFKYDVIVNAGRFS